MNLLDFYKARNSLVPEVFEQKWTQLDFTTSIQTTSYIESYNAQVKRLILNSNVSLIELAEALEASIEEESKKAKYAYWKTQIPLTLSATTLPQALFYELDKALSHFITPGSKKFSVLKSKDIHSDLQEELYYIAAQFSKNYSQDQLAEFAKSNMNRLFTPDLLNEIQEDELVIDLADDGDGEICSNSLYDNEEYEDNNVKQRDAQKVLSESSNQKN
ncbi:17886_t:CDS:2 [Racocetra fulgida]|uniref:17886_t:CDS:1 n=1 Tax=Racocetra fulgida TaxID=60492 RepID=A0A9N8WA00_9GLOM|nr:17886_t:CDS:2 [Racocetra fulgida]